MNTHKSVRLLLLAMTTLVASTLSAADLHERARDRRPVALVISDHLYVANQRSGSLSVVDLKTHSVVGEVRVGEELTDVALVKGGRLVVTDGRRHELILLTTSGGQLRVRNRLPLPKYPVCVVVARDGSFCCVSSLWSRQLVVVDLPPNDAVLADAQAVSVIDMPFAPRRLWLSPDETKLVVADAFGGRLGVVDVKKRKLVSLRSIETHNIGGMSGSADGRELLISHQLLNDQVPTVRERIFWGAVVSNILRSVTLQELFEPHDQPPTKPKPIAHWSLVPLGQPKEGAGDPGELITTKQGKAIVTLAGVDQVAVQFDRRGSFARFHVGRRPTALALSPDERILYVANTLDDSVSAVDLVNRETLTTISLGRRPKPTAADRGESLFFDARLSLDGWYSCHSCHTDGHTNGLLNDNFGDDSTGAPKRVLTLLGVTETNPWAWNGRRETLAAQIHNSFETTMRAKEGAASPGNVAALEEYLKTLKPPPSLPRARGTIDQSAAARGERLFDSLGCADCHIPPTYTSADVFDVNLQDETGETEFNPPSLRGASQRSSFFHDGRAKSLREVLSKFNHPQKHQLSAEQLKDLLEFLRSL